MRKDSTIMTPTHAHPATTHAKLRPGIDGIVSILVHVQPDAAKRLAAARALAERTDAILIGVGAQAVPPVAAGPATGFVQSEWYAATSGAAETSLATARTMFDAACVGLAAGSIWEQGLDLPSEAMSRAARGADIIVTSAPAGAASLYADASPADLAMSSGRPVLVVAADAPPLKADRIVLAWKETREARRAMADALPFLRAAERVLVLSVTAESPAYAQEVIDDVAQALQRHGVTTETKVVTAAGHEGRRILEEASAFGADLVIAGCYGHSRFGEWLFGGVTRELLGQDACHVLLSH
jgi:nucleotide-binding universal stress UspA family protein